MNETDKKKRKRGTKKNNVVLREKLLANGNISLYLDIYRDSERTYEFLKLHINKIARTPLEKEQKKQTYLLAEAIRTQRESDLNHSLHGQISPAKQKVFFFDYAEDYLNNYKKKDVRMLKGAIERFKTYLSETLPGSKLATFKLSSIDKKMLVDFVDYLKEKSKGEGAHSYFQRFKKVLTHAVEEGIILKSPAFKVECKGVEGLRKDILSNDEIALLAKTPCQNSNIKRAFIFSCCTGLRFCDIKALTFSDIDYSTGKLNIDQQKTGKPAIIDLNPTAFKIISETGEPENLVFTLPTFEGCVKTVQAWVTRAGIKKHITWHCARHSFAVNLLTSKEKPDIKTVSSTLGHTTLKHTEKYTRVIDKLKKEAVNALPDYEF